MDSSDERSKLIHELFEEQVLRDPTAIAVVFQGRRMTYAELSTKASRLAKQLRAQGIGPETLVGVCVERSAELVVALLGILKSGAAYIPLDPTYPSERLTSMVQDANPRALLVQNNLVHLFHDDGSNVVTLEKALQDTDGMRLDEERSACEAHDSSSLAYVIYTSGSTGKPKGVMVEHRQVTWLFSAMSEIFKIQPGDVWTLFHSYAFDFSVWEMWGALLYGGRLIVVPYAVSRSPDDFYQLLCDESVTVLNQTPSAFARLMDAQSRSQAKHSLRTIFFGGEALSPSSLQPWVRRNGAAVPSLINMYGITETTVFATYFKLSAKDIEIETHSIIGSALPYLSTHILNEHLESVAPGECGEIYISGSGVSRGYLKRPELTAERFIADISSRERMYKTGDLARIRPDGSLESLGRNDHQVKIRGFRIELGEIEQHLLRNEAIRHAIVMVRSDIPGEKRLVAYVIPKDTLSVPSADELRASLVESLPDYMVPAAFVSIEKLPLTENGKLDRSALPVPSIGSDLHTDYEAPDGDTETGLSQIWAEALGIDRISRYDNLYELGGDSITAIKIIALTSARLGTDLQITTVLQCANLKELAEHIEQSRQG